MHGLMLVFTLWVGPGGHRPADHWFGPDKAKHFLASAFIETTGYAMMRGMQATRQQSLMAASAVTAAAGVTKELMDHRRGGAFSFKDLTWDALGGITMGLAFRHGP